MVSPPRDFESLSYNYNYLSLFDKLRINFKVRDKMREFSDRQAPPLAEIGCHNLRILCGEPS